MASLKEESWAQLSKRVLFGRWFVVFVSFFILSCSGGTYVFGVYSETIKTNLGYNQKTLQTLAFFKDLGANISIISGLLNEVFPSWVVLAVGAVMNVVGYSMIWLSVTHQVGRPAPWQMYTYLCMGSTSQSFANTGILVACVNNFPQSRGVVLGILKGFVGLSGAMFTQLYHAVYGAQNADGAAGIILLLAVIPSAVSFFTMLAIRPTKPVTDHKELTHFYRFLYIALALAGFLMVFTIVENQGRGFPVIGFRAVMATVILFLFLNLFVVVKAEIEGASLNYGSPSPSQSIGVKENIVSLGDQGSSEQKMAKRSCLARTFIGPERGEDYTILQATFSVDMIILFSAMACGIGSTLTAIDNLGQIGKSLGYTQQNISTFVALVSIWNFLGRVAGGFASEVLLQKYKFPRPLCMSAVLLLSSLGHALIALGFNGSLYIASVIIGVCFGAQWPLMYSVISELFGLKYFATLHCLGTAASPVGFYLLSVLVAGNLYDKAADRQSGSAGGSQTCVGTECFRLSFVIMAVVCVIGCLISLVLVVRTKEFYKGDIYAKHREASKPMELDDCSAAAAKDEEQKKPTALVLADPKMSGRKE